MAINLSKALNRLNTEGIDISADFHTLRSSQVDVILECAMQDKYRAPKVAPGSTARMYWQALQRMHKRNMIDESIDKVGK